MRTIVCYGFGWGAKLQILLHLMSAQSALRHLPVGAAKRFVDALFVGCHMSPADASVATGAIIAADLRGAYTHGLAHVPWYIGMLASGSINPAGKPRIAKENGSAILVDGDNSLGHVAVTFALNAAVSCAQTNGVAAVAVGGSNHCGALGYYAAKAAAQDMIALVSTNAMPTMAPWGGLERIVGINPIAIGIPARSAPPIVIDTSFGAAARAKIGAHANEGRPLPAGWAYDASGSPTTDPNVALEGLIAPIGGFKGVGLAIAFGMLSTLLSGAAYGSQLGDLRSGAKLGRDGQFVLALSVAAFEDLERFKSRVDEIVDEVHQSRRAPGVGQLYVPGEQAAEKEVRYQKEGIPVSDSTWQGLLGAAKRVGVKTELLTQAMEETDVS